MNLDMKAIAKSAISRLNLLIFISNQNKDGLTRRAQKIAKRFSVNEFTKQEDLGEKASYFATK